MLITPGRAPPTLTHTSRSARPIVAFARKPAPNTDAAQLTSSARRTGPLTITSGATASVVPETPTSAKSGSQIPSTAASTTGSEHHRQILRTAAGHHRVDGDALDGGAPVRRRDQADQLVATPSAGRDRRLHALGRRRHHGQTVGHAARKELLDRVGGLGAHAEDFIPSPAGRRRQAEGC